ncbi:unnamed protein product (macronuclear) [Paramecium tetraurelia]|uniref:Transmembrane protein n=1 Tax=Paramecium tetraurelia TaxID=5888 RepID=A0DR61_PARTE|nr:uncharacterized protein GSPATT00019245001 [Paramecium tetraurelia]CAK85528.1 unnamed protein product [Paramecium tetraurelia]|eukprot:XP_001452925.1 hypothetical protein (macronuclear) [Paramecium tetraurelia strain d4-2]
MEQPKKIQDKVVIKNVPPAVLNKTSWLLQSIFMILKSPNTSKTFSKSQQFKHKCPRAFKLNSDFLLSFQALALQLHDLIMNYQKKNSQFLRTRLIHYPYHFIAKKLFNNPKNRYRIILSLQLDNLVNLYVSLIVLTFLQAYN